jgi:tetratricopeptide (TPR) repeat protein
MNACFFYALAGFFIGMACAEENVQVKLNNEGVALLGKGDYQSAIARLEAAYRIDRANDTVTTNLASAHLKQADALIKGGELQEAVHSLDEAINLGIGDDVTRNNLAATYNEIANIYMRRKQYAEGVSLLRTAVSLKPENAVLRCNLGVALYHDNKLRNALDEFLGVINNYPDNAVARKMAGVILYNKGEMRGAIRELKVAAELNPADEDVQSLLKKAKKEFDVEKDFDVDRHVHFTVSFDGRKDYRIGRDVIDALDRAWLSVGQDFGFYPSERIAVIIYSDRQFRGLLNKSRNVGGLYDGKIRVPVGGLDSERDKEKLRKVLLHEYAHVVVHLLSHNRCPLWLNEGIAEYESEEWTEGKREKLVVAIENGRYIPLPRLSATLKNFNSPDIGLAYLEAFSVVRFIAEGYGVYNLKRILGRLDEGDDIDKALKSVISLDMKQLEGEWIRSFR